MLHKQECRHSERSTKELRVINEIKKGNRKKGKKSTMLDIGEMISFGQTKKNP